MSKKIISIIVAIALVITAVVVINPFKKDIVEASSFRNGFSLVPDEKDATGVLEDSTFTLTFTEDKNLTLSEIESMITFSHGELFIKEESKEVFKIRAANRLPQNEIIRFELIDKNDVKTSWVFQTATKLKIVSSFPGDKTSNVPLASGIEIYFNKEGVKDFEKHFNITPSVKGTFEYRNNVAIFVPEELEPGTLYTVTIDSLLKVENGNYPIEEDYSFSFETALDEKTNNDFYNEGYFAFDKRLQEVATDEEILVPINYYLNDEFFKEDTYDLETTVYTFNNVDNFLDALNEQANVPRWANYSYQTYVYDTKNLNKVLEKSFKLKKRVENDFDRLLSYKRDLPKGYYLVEAVFNDRKVQMFLEVTDIGVFNIESTNGMLFWIKSMVSEENVKDAVLELNENQYLSDDDGIIFANIEVDNTLYAKISKDDDAVVIPIYSTTQYYSENQYFWNYLSTDRTKYKPEDRIEFFGFIKDRYRDREIDKVTLEISTGGYYPMYMDIEGPKGYNHYFYYPGMNDPIMKKTIEVKNGGLYGYFDLPSLKEGSYQLSVKYEDQIITSTYVQIENYKKPAYKFEMTKDKEAIFLGESVNFNIKSSFFEGTSVSNLDFRYDIHNHFGGNTVSKEAKTDIDGEYTIKYNPNNFDNAQGERSAYINVSVMNPEIGEIYINDRVRVFINDIYPEYEGTLDDNVLTLKAHVYNVDLDKINQSDSYESNYQGTAKEGALITGTIYKHTYYKVESGSYYDYINKIKRKSYRYEEKKEEVKTINLTTNEDGFVEFSMDAEEFDGHYTAELELLDSNQRLIKNRVYFSRVGNYGRIEYNNDYSEILVNQDHRFEIGDKVIAEYIYQGNSNVEGSYLFINMQNGIRSYDVLDNSIYEFTFGESEIPNVDIKAVYFNGNTFESINSFANYNYEKENLLIVPTLDKDSYGPSDVANLNIKVSDVNGNPVKGLVNIAIVDEALFALSDQYIDTLASLYRSVQNGLMYTYISHNMTSQNTFYGYNVRAMDGAGLEMAKGEVIEMAMDDSMDQNESSFVIRSEFKDTAYFATVYTDENGNADLQINLPDNITKFRVTMQAISEDLKAGSEKTSLDISIPFFINYSLSDTFLVGDEPSIGITPFGGELSENDTVYIQIEGDNNTDIYKTKAFTRTYIPLWKMENPSDALNEITIKAWTEKDGKKYTDAITHYYRVEESYHEVTITNETDVKVGMNFESGQDGMTKYIFVNKNMTNEISSLFQMSSIYGNRIEQKLVENRVRKMLNQLFDSEYEIEDVSFIDYQQQDGGISFLTYGSSDIFTTVDVMPYIIDEIDVNLLKAYLYNKKADNDDITSTLAAIYGLAYLGEPVLNDLEYYKELDALDIDDLIYLALGYAAFDEIQIAKAIYSENILNEIIATEKTARIDVGKDIEEKLKNTARLTVLASIIDSGEKEKLFEYINKEYSKVYLTILEKYAYLNNEIVDSKVEDVSLTYSYLDEVKEITLGSNSHQITIPSKMSNELKVLKADENVAVISVYEDYRSLEEANNSYVSIEREYENYSHNGKDIEKNDLIKVTLKINIDQEALELGYEVTDYLPSGLRAVENFQNMRRDNDEILYYANAVGQKVIFNVYGSRKENKQITISYLARVVNPGKYTAESAYMVANSDSSLITYTNRDIIEID